MNSVFFLFLLGLIHVHLAGSELLSHGTGTRVDVVSYGWDYYPPDFRNPLRYTQLKEHFDLSFSSNVYRYVQNFKNDDLSLHKVVFIDFCGDPKTCAIPKSKLICFVWEAHKLDKTSAQCDYYDRIYTFDDDLVDNIKFFKYHYPVLRPMLTEIPAYCEKKLCVMMASRWIPERLQLLDFFAAQPGDLLHVYGQKIRELLPQHSNLEMIKGEVPGYPSSFEKLNTIKNYRFCICFENKHTVPGYITEKIFDVFASGCVPIYWGPDNIEQYVPSQCFIDYRQFKDDQEMLEFITSIDEVAYNQYLTNIRAFLESDQAKLFSLEAFEQILFDAVKN